MRKLCTGAQYKFIVDGAWKYAPDQPAMHDERDIVNNVVEVQEYVPDHLDSLIGFEPPPSPPDRCGDRSRRRLLARERALALFP